MSCQQLIQEDPYIFTDTVSNSTNFMQHNNSQTKYVPLNRQTIYNRQFRQHEPSIASAENFSINGHVAKSPQPLVKRNGGILNGTSPTPLPTRTSPKFFKTQQSPSLKGQYLANSSDNKLTTHHSITVSSSQSAVPIQQQKQQESQLGHVATTCVDGDNKKLTTGINRGPLNGKSHAMTLNGGQPTKYRTKISAKSQKVIVEVISISASPEIPSLYDVPPLWSSHKNTCVPRDERIKQKKIQLRRQMQQFKGIQQYRTTERSKNRFSKTLKLLRLLDRAKDEIFTRPHKSCQFDKCSEDAIASTQHCINHILLADKSQHLFRQCCFVHSHGGLCRVPVSDVMATIAVCNEHQNAPAHQLIDPAKPKKPPTVATATQIQARKRTINTQDGVLKKNGKKKPAALVKPTIIQRPAKMIIHPNDIQKPTQKILIQHQKIEAPATENQHQFIHQNSGNLLASSQSSYSSITSVSDDIYLKPDLMTICENSYESSEDTGVGGLSENELMSQDVMGTLDMESSDELTKVLSSLDDLLTEPLQTTRDEEEYLDRAIEEVSSVGIDQIAITAFDGFDGLGDMLELMDDEEERRQMISAATNLISMSSMQSFLPNHDQDYSALPSPMMS